MDYNGPAAAPAAPVGAQNFVMDYIPSSINYRLPQAIGMPHRLTQAKWSPIGSVNSSLTTNDVVKFQVATPHFWDPYSAFLEVRLDIEESKLETRMDPTNYRDATNPILQNKVSSKCLQLDGCSQSLLRSMVITNNGKELERISELDTIMNMVKDVSYGRAVRTTKDHEGLGGQMSSNFTSHASFMRQPRDFANTQGMNDVRKACDPIKDAAVRENWWQSGATGLKYKVSQPTEQPGLGDKNMAGANAGVVPIPSLFYDPLRNYNYTYTGKLVPNDDKVFNDLQPHTNLYHVPQAQVTPTAQNTVSSDAARLAPDPSTRKTCGPSPVVQHILYDCPNLGFETPFTYDEDEIIRAARDAQGLSGGYYPRQVNDCVYPNDPEFVTRSQRIPTVGYHNPFPANFGTTTFEPILSLEPQRCIINGKPKCQAIREATFYIPLPSGIFGVLMSPTNYKLIPMVAFKNLTFEFQFSDFAFFTSWSSSNRNDRDYRILQVQLHAEIAEFMDLNVIRATNWSLTTGFSICTQSYQAGPIITMPGNNVVNTIQVNLSYDSLKAIFFCFLDTNYKSNTMYRKQYRMSANLTSIQLKVGTDYIPSHRIEGHAGNNFGKVNCYPFYLETLKALGKLNSGVEMAINPHNFAINWRESYAAATLASKYPQSTWTLGADGKLGMPYWLDKDNNWGLKDGPDATPLFNPVTSEYKAVNGAVNYHSLNTHKANLVHYAASVYTGAQLSFYLENRIVGKAFYGIDLDSLNYENAILSGIRTKEARPFEIMLTNDNSEPFPGYLECYVFCYYDMIVNISGGEVVSLGK